MSDTLQAITGFNVFKGRRGIAAGMLGMLVLAGCGTVTEQVATTPKPNSTATGEAPQPSSTTEAPKTGMVTDIPQMSAEYLQYTENFMSVIYGKSGEDSLYLAARYGAYYYDVVGKNGACITQYEAELNEAVRQSIVDNHMKVRELNPAYYDEVNGDNKGDYNMAIRLESPSKALVKAAATEEECPAGNNDTVVTFSHDGQEYATSAQQLLFFSGGITEAKQFKGGILADMRKYLKKTQAEIDAIDPEVTGVSVDPETLLYLYIGKKITAEKYAAQIKLLERYNG